MFKLLIISPLLILISACSVTTIDNIRDTCSQHLIDEINATEALKRLNLKLRETDRQDKNKIRAYCAYYLG